MATLIRASCGRSSSRRSGSPSLPASSTTSFFRGCCERLAEVTGLDRALPANGGAEAVETALKAARKWGHKIKGIPADRAEIIVCAGNFHGRSITIVGFSSEPQYRDGFGPFAPGFRQVPYGDAEALARAIGPNTAAFLVEPIQGEGGILVPPAGYLAECARICRENNVLLICDEIQTGMGRTGKFLACEHENVEARRHHPRQGAGRRTPAGVGARRHRRPDAGVLDRAITAALSAAIRSPPPWRWRRSTCCSTKG